jgi:hypothetical protein
MANKSPPGPAIMGSTSKRDTSPVPLQISEWICLKATFQTGGGLLSRLPSEKQRPIHHHVEHRIRLRLVYQNALAIGRNFEWRCDVRIGSQGK